MSDGKASAEMLFDNAVASPGVDMAGPSAKPARKPATNVAVAVPVALTAVAIAVHLVVMRQFGTLGVYDQYNVLFSADPNTRIADLSHGWPSADTIHPALLSSVHPFFAYYFGPAIRLLAKSLGLLGFAGAGEPALRIALGVLVVPVVSGLQTGALYAVLVALRYRMDQAATVAALATFSFTGLVFGAIPDHFAVTNLAVTAMLLLAAASVARGRSFALPGWATLGVLAAGITITNLVIFGIVHWGVALARRHRFWPATLRTGLLGVSIFAFVILSALVIATLHDVKRPTTAPGQGFVSGYLILDGPGLLDRLSRAPTALGNAMAPPPPARRTDVLLADEPITFAFTFDTTPGIFSTANPLGLLGFLMILLGGATMIAKGGPCRSMALISLGMLGFNLVLHTVWGGEHFLYSQHWITPALVLLSGIFHARPRADRIVITVLGLYVIAVAASNGAVIGGMVAEIAAATGRAPPAIW